MEDSKNENLTTIMDLPDDWLILIFKRLDDERFRDAFGLTCSKWLGIQNRNRLSLQFDCSFTCFKNKLSSTPHKVGIYDLQKILTRFQHLRSLSLSGCTELPDAGLKVLQSFGSNLRALHLDCCFNITDTGLSYVASGCPLLMYISLYRCKVTDLGLMSLAMSCFNLEDVNLSYCVFITDDGINYLVQNCSRLYGIRINNCREIRGTGFRGCSKKLAYLEAESCKLEPEGIASMVSGGGLEYLNVLNHGRLIYGRGLSAIGGGTAKMLRILNMRSCRVTDEDVAAIAKGCPLLVEWNLAMCHEIRLHGWKSIALNCHKLERLHLNGCRNLSIALVLLKSGCKNLSVLYLDEHAEISEIGIVDMFSLISGVIVKRENVATNPNWQCTWQQRIFVE